MRGYAPGSELVFDGEFGIPGALHGRVVIGSTPTGADASTVTLTHTVIAAIPEGGEVVHAAGWADVLQRLCAVAAG